MLIARYKSILFCVFFIIAWACQYSTADETNGISPSKYYLMAYESMTTADWLKKREMNEDAVAFYNEALKSFQQLASNYPLWQTNVVAFRINYCRDELNKILEPARSTPAPLNASKQVPEEPTRSAATLPTMDGAGANEALAEKIKEAVRLEQAGDFKGALETYRIVLEQHKQHPTALSGIGRCYLRLGLIDEARSFLFQWCVVPAPENSINLLLAIIFCHDRQYDKAVQLAEIVLNEGSRSGQAANANAHVILGVALAGTGQIDAAISEMQKALAINPSLSEAHYNLACLIHRKNPKQDATAGAYYLNALKFGAAPDPALSKLLQK